MSVRVDVLHFGQELTFEHQENLVFLKHFVFFAVSNNYLGPGRGVALLLLVMMLEAQTLSITLSLLHPIHMLHYFSCLVLVFDVLALLEAFGML